MPVNNMPLTQMTGLASGLDWGGIIDKQMEQARKRETPWFDRIQLLNDKIFLYQEFAAGTKGIKKALDPLKLKSTFTAKTPELITIGGSQPPESIMKVELDPSAQIDKWRIKVNSLAIAERRISDRQESVSVGLDKSGSFFLRCGTKATEITYASSDSLRSVAEKIRQSNVGVDAYLVDNRLVIESKEPGLGGETFTEHVTRGAGDIDTLGANAIDPVSIGDITVTKKKDDGTTEEVAYLRGIDFDVEPDSVTGGYNIRWLTTNRPAEESQYNVKYEYDANTFGIYEIRDSQSESLTRDAGDDYDTLVGTDLDLNTVNIAGYVQGTDYEIVTDPDDGSKLAVHWLGGTRPADGQVYSVDYSTNANSLLDSLGILTEDVIHHTAPVDASLTVNGIDVTRSSNDIEDLIGGAKLHLKGPGEVDLEINLNAQKAVESIQSFVEGYNELMDYINIRGKEKTYNYSEKPGGADVIAKPEDDLKRRKGLLAGDPILWRTKSDLRRILSERMSEQTQGENGETQTTGLDYLSALGITTEKVDFGKSGKLEFDTKKFMEAMTADPKMVQKTVAAAVKKVDEYLDGVISTKTVEIGGAVVKKGSVQSQINTWENEVSQIQKRIKNFEARLSTQQLNMYKQYSSMERRMAKMQAQMASMANIFAALNKTQNAANGSQY